jgi:ABC-type amino acid transport substrate-binding protein
MTLDFSESYMLVTLGLVVKDYRIKEFVNTNEIRKMSHLKLAVVKGASYKDTLLDTLQFTDRKDKVEFVELESVEDFYTGKVDADALLTSAEQGAAYCMLYTRYQTVVPKPVMYKEAIAYVIAKNDLAFSKYLNEWLAIKKAEGDVKKLKNYWILGKGVEYKTHRWNLLDVLLGNTNRIIEE